MFLSFKLCTFAKGNCLKSSSSSSCPAASTDPPDPLTPPISIVHCPQEVFKVISYTGAVLLYIGSSWSSYLCSSMWRGPQEYIAYEFILTSRAVSRMSGSSNFDSFRDGWAVAVQLLFCGVLPPGLVQYSSQHCIKTNLALNKSQRLLCHKTKLTKVSK